MNNTHMICKSLLLTLMLFGLVAISTAQSQQDYEKFRNEVCEKFLAQSKKVNEEYKLGSYSRWDFSQDTGQIIFSDNGVPKVIAKVQIAGTWSNVSNTWMWSWNNKSIDALVKKDIETVRKFGQEKKYVELTDAQWESTSDYAWTTTAVAGHILNAKTAYRGETGTGYAYFLVFVLKWADATK